LAMDLQAFLDELVCLSLIGAGETILRAFCSSVLWQIYQTLYLLVSVQECRFITPSQDARVIVLSMGGWDTHSSVLGFQTQQIKLIFVSMFSNHVCSSPMPSQTLI
jgi:hypothetical protein